jgi:T5SS/PEP-CTERM-associated repeat protein
MKKSRLFGALDASLLLPNLFPISVYADGMWKSTLKSRNPGGDNYTIKAYYNTVLGIAKNILAPTPDPLNNPVPPRPYSGAALRRHGHSHRMTSAPARRLMAAALLMLSLLMMHGTQAAPGPVTGDSVWDPTSLGLCDDMEFSDITGLEVSCWNFLNIANYQGLPDASATAYFNEFEPSKVYWTASTLETWETRTGEVGYGGVTNEAVVVQNGNVTLYSKDPTAYRYQVGELRVNNNGTLNLGQVGGPMVLTTSVEVAISEGGAVNVVGAGSQLLTLSFNPDSFFVGGTSAGANGTGSLSASSNGLISLRDITVYDSGTVNVAAGGQFRTNEMNIAGGSVTSWNGQVGGFSPGYGLLVAFDTASVYGGGSWTNFGNLVVGNTANGKLDIRTGGSVSNVSAYIGFEAGTTGTVNVIGTDSSWTSSDFLILGQDGDARLTVSNGGTVSSRSMNIGSTGSSTGTVSVAGNNSSLSSSGMIIGVSGNATIDLSGSGRMSNGDIFDPNTGNAWIAAFSGPGYRSDGAVTVRDYGSIWSNTGSLLVGRGGDGRLDITGGGRVNNGSGSVGTFGGAVGAVTVSGANSTWDNRSSLLVGEYGTGTLQISAGGRVNNGSGSVGTFGGAVGTVTVSGANSTWDNQSSLLVGEYGSGTLDVSAGGRVVSNFGYLAYNPYSFGLATVSGATWDNSGEMYVGASGTGRLEIFAGGTVSNTNGWVGTNAGSDGLAIIDASTWTNNGSLLVGYSGKGRVDISGGGSVTSGSGFLGYNAGSQGAVFVSGPGSNWANAGDLSVGGPLGGNGSLYANAGGLVTVGGSASVLGSGIIGTRGGGNVSANALNITGGAVDSVSGFIGADIIGQDGWVKAATAATVQGAGSIWTNLLSLFVGGASGGSLDVSNAGRINNWEALIAFDFNTSGTATVSGAGSSWDNGSRMIVGNGGNGTLDISNGGSVSNTDGYIGYLNQGSGEVTVSGGANWTNAGNLYVGGNSSSAAGTGSLAASNGGTVTVGGELKIWDTGTVDLAGGTLNTTTLSNLGTFNFSGGTLSVDQFIGDLVNNGGTLAPGDSPGTTNITGNYSQSIDSVYAVEMGGKGLGQFDVLNVAGTATLAGTLNATLFNLGGGVFNPGLGDSFDILLAEVISGEFDFYTLATLDEGLRWDVSYLADAIGSTDVVRLSVQAVPIPPAAWLFGSGLLGLIGVARRRKSA